MKGLRFIDIEPEDPRLLSDVLPVLTELRPHIDAQSLSEVYREGYGQGLRFTCAYDEFDQCVSVAGWRVVATTVVIRKLYVDDLVTTQDLRSRGAGQALLGELERRARAVGCRIIDLDSGLDRAGTHRFYFREGMAITAFHFARKIEP